MAVNINITRKLSGIPDGDLVTQEIIDEHIASLAIANGRAQYELWRDGLPWQTIAATMAASQQLNRLDVVEFALDGNNHIGFFPAHPVGTYAINQGEVSQEWQATIMFLE